VIQVNVGMDRSNNSSSICNQPQSESHHDFNPLPPLNPPANTKVYSLGSGGNDFEYSSKATIETSLTTKTLAIHYEAELIKAGWKKIEFGQSNCAIWSGWKFKDIQGNYWDGVLIFTQSSGQQNKYLASISLVKL
jgi:hypothetical protein